MKALALLLAALFSTAEVVSTEAQRLTQHGDAQLAAGDAAGAAQSYREAIASDGRAFEARVNLGAALVELGDVEGAIDSLLAARKSHPDSAPLLRNLGRAYMAREKWPDAAEVLKKARAIDPANDNAIKLLGIALERSGAHGDAIALLKQAASTRPKDAELLVELASAQSAAKDSAAGSTLDRARKVAGDGRAGARIRNEIALLLRTQGKTKDALAEFRAAAKLDPTYSPAIGNLGMALVEAGEWANAKGTLETAARHDNDPQLRYFLGQAKLETGDVKGAISDLESARSWGYDPRAIAGMLARCWEAQGEAAKADNERTRAGATAGFAAVAEDARKGFELLQKGNFEKALPLLESAVKADPKDYASQFNLGLARLKSGNAAAAIGPLREAAPGLIDQDVVWYALGTAYEKSGDLPHAAGAWTEMLARFPDRGDVTARLGHLLLELGQDSAAVDRLREAQKALPKDPSVKYDLAVALVRLKHSGEALAPLKAYLAERGDDLEAREAWAHALADTGATKDAAAEFARLSAAQPSIARHSVNAAVAWRKLGDTKQEKTWLEKAATLAPGDPQVANDLARLQFQDRDWAAAEKSFTRAAQLDASNADAAKNAETARKNAELETTKATRLHLGVIVVKDKAQADLAAKRLAKGEDFANVAKALSTHESAANGGDLGWVEPAALPEWAAAAKDLKPGDRTAATPLAGGFAFFLHYRD